MIQSFRKIMFSKIGAAVTLGFILLIAIAFAAGDVIGTGGFNRVAAGDEIAEVGSKSITAAEYEKAIQAAFENARQEDPRLTLKAFLQGDTADQVLAQMTDRAALAAFGEKHGMVISQRLIDREITKLPIAQGPDGRFSQTMYEQMLQQRGLTDRLVREDLASGLIARQILVPAAFGSKFPNDAALRYAALLKETRRGAIALLPSAAFAPKSPPTDAEVAAHYQKTRNNYLVPERRVIRYAVFDETAVEAPAAPTDAEIAARYNANKAAYAASETRRLTQLILPTEAAARAVMDEVAKGTSLERAAGAKGLSTSSLTVGKQALAGQTSQGVADAAFAARSGAVAGPARSGLGWHIVRVDGIDSKPARTLDQVRGELAGQLIEIKRRQAAADYSARIEEEFENGGSLSDVARELGLTLTETEPLTADGKVYGKPDQSAPGDLARVVATAFAMERENQPQLAEVEPGKKFVVFDVTRIAPSAPAPLAEVKEAVTTELMLQKGSADAKAAADKVLAAAKKGADLAAAMREIGVPLPPVDRIDLNREQLASTRQVPPPLALLFSMAQGTTKLLPAPRNRGWYVVSLKEIVPGKVAADDPLVAEARKELGQIAGREYADQLRRAIRGEVGVKRNDKAIGSVRTQLAGGN